MELDLDKHNAIAANAAAPITILGNVETSDFELVDLRTWQRTEAADADVMRRRLGYLGIAGVVNGKPECALAEELDVGTISLLASAVAHHLSATAGVLAVPTA